MLREQQEGVCLVNMRTGYGLRFARVEAENIRNALERSATWFTGTGLYGATLTVEIAQVYSVIEETPESLAAHQADVMTSPAPVVQ